MLVTPTSSTRCPTTVGYRRTRGAIASAFTVVVLLLVAGCSFDLPDVVAEGSPDASFPDTTAVPDAQHLESGSGGSSSGASGQGGDPQQDCKSGYKLCEGECVRTDDPEHGCGDVGCAPCGSTTPHATFACNTGTCVMVSCAPGYGDCDVDPTNGCETNLSTDVKHCGTCDRACSSTNGTPSCTDGRCHVVCETGYGDCNGDPSDGCEADLSSAAHCGSCGFSCPSRPHASPYCKGNGQCGYQCVGAGGIDRYENCDGSWDNGCEVYMTGNPDNCGTCGNVCPDPGLPHVQRACDPVIPNCTGICEPGYYTCDDTWDNGCESTTPCK